MDSHFTVNNRENSKIFLPIIYIHKYPPSVKQGDDSSGVNSIPELVESENDDYYDCDDNPPSPSL